MPDRDKIEKRIAALRLDADGLARTFEHHRAEMERTARELAHVNGQIAENAYWLEQSQEGGPDGAWSGKGARVASSSEPPIT